MALRTRFDEDVLDVTTATNLYHYIRDNTEWEDGVRSRKGFTRKAKALDITDDDIIMTYVIHALEKLAPQTKSCGSYILDGIYLNYYEDGEMYTPNHSHPKQHQLVISLGATRTLIVGKKPYAMTHGNAIRFGSSVHGVSK